MRIATWNVNSLKARLDKVTWWLERAKPDVLLMQETKLSDADAPVATFKNAGYELLHHGEGRWNGRRDREPGRHQRRDRELRPAAAPAGDARRAGRRAAVRGADGLGGSAAACAS
jgi:hypothetical protein